jgi:hypothetical protein
MLFVSLLKITFSPYTVHQCASGATCILEIRTGLEKSGPLFRSFSSANPPGTSLLVPGSQIYIKFTATDPAVKFLATWSCTEEGGYKLCAIFVSDFIKKKIQKLKMVAWKLGHCVPDSI